MTGSRIMYRISDYALTPEGLDEIEKILRPKESKKHFGPLPKCVECERKVYPSWQFCPECGEMQWEWVEGEEAAEHSVQPTVPTGSPFDILIRHSR